MMIKFLTIAAAALILTACAGGDYATGSAGDDNSDVLIGSILSHAGSVLGQSRRPF